MDKVVTTACKEFYSDKFNSEWKALLTEIEQQVFYLYYFEGNKIFQIAMKVNYSDRQVKRFLKSAKKKIYKTLP